MGMAKLNIYVSGIDDPCGFDKRTWYITIFNCDGSVLDYCGKRYVVMRAPCGHLEVDVPPGCYYIKAVWGFTVVTPGLVYRANHFTDAAIVQACCEQHVCVKLFNPSVHRCGFIYVRALRDMAAQKAVDPALADRGERLVKQVLGQDKRNTREAEGPPAALERFETAPEFLEELPRLVKRQAKEDQ